VEDRPLDEQALVERACKGDMQAYAALIELHQAIAFRTAYLITRNDADATDAIQEAFIRAHAALGRFRRGAPFRPWLLRIVANEAKDRRAAGARYSRLSLRAAGEHPPRGDESSPELIVVARSEQEEVLAALDELSERDRQVIAFRFFLELSEEEMAIALGVPRGTVKSRLSRALDRLRNAMEAPQ
jgi:RNA polymerase sigma factor (sigma-70 family)